MGRKTAGDWNLFPPRRKGGKYRARRNANGKTQERALSADRGESTRLLRKLRTSTRDVVPSRASMSELAPHWLDGLLTRNAKGRELMASRLRDHHLPEFGMMRPDRITRGRLLEYRTRLVRKGLSKSTANALLGEMRTFLRWAATSEYIDAAPSFEGLLFKLKRPMPKRLTPEEEAIVRGLDGELGRIARFLLGTGLRWGEACNAQASDIQRNRRGDRFLAVPEAKSGEPRLVPLALAWPEIEGRVGKLVPYAASSAGTFNRRVKAATEIPDFHAHRCRHTFACTWLETGGSKAALQRILGHKMAATTERYGQTSDDYNALEAEAVLRRRQAEGGDDLTMEVRV